MGAAANYVWLDPDGLGGSPPIYALCDYSSDDVSVTHNYWLKDITHSGGWYWSRNYHYENPLSWQLPISYYPNIPADINEFLLNQAKAVAQQVSGTT